MGTGRERPQFPRPLAQDARPRPGNIPDPSLPAYALRVRRTFLPAPSDLFRIRVRGDRAAWALARGLAGAVPGLTVRARRNARVRSRARHARGTLPLVSAVALLVGRPP